MKIGGFQSFSLSDYPGRISAIVFTQGCNFRCPFCHNGKLLDVQADEKDLIPESEVMALLTERQGKLQGLVVTGGEPTLQSDLGDFLKQVKALGYRVKLDTNGGRPDVVRRLIDERLIDYIAMDIKAPREGYDRLTGVRAPIDRILESIDLIAASGLEHEFRTTVVEALLSPAEVEAIKAMVPAGSTHRLQTFRPETALDPALRETETASPPVQVIDMMQLR